MKRYWISGTLFVSAVAMLKTGLVIIFAVEPGRADFAMVTAMFALFFALTGAVAYFCFSQIHSLFREERRKLLSAGGGDPTTKESVIARYASDWGLSQAEADVAIFVAKGFSNSEVAEMRGCAIATVKSQLSSIYSKSGLGSRYQLIAFVTDEVCADARDTENESENAAIPTRRLLPLVGRNKSARSDQVQA